jgi:hypothetical protein
MIQLDQLILGDNQFFGINHMSQEKGQQLAEKFSDLGKVYRVYHAAHGLGIRAFMLNSNDRAAEICEYLRAHKSDFPGMVLYPSIPYPHKYANQVAEKGIAATIQNVLSGQSALDLFSMFGKGVSLLAGDLTKLMTLLVDVEMKMFKGLDFKAIYLQNVITDLLLGLEFKEIFIEYSRYVEKAYGATPGYLTMNVPKLSAFLQECGITNATICGSVNKAGYLMSPDVAAYESYFKGPQPFPISAMSILASGAIAPREAVEYVKAQGIRSIVFGASSEPHMKETLELVQRTEAPRNP